MQSFIPMHLKLEIKWANSLKKQLIKTNMRRNKKYEQCSIKDIKFLIKVFSHYNLQA